MAAIQLSKTASTLPPTVRTLASGVPGASLINLAARTPAGAAPQAWRIVELEAAFAITSACGSVYGDG